MLRNLHYAAYSYLDEWMRKDRRFHQKLTDRRVPEVDGASWLVQVANYYSISRTLPLIEKEGTQRLSLAYDSLQSVSNVDSETMVKTVQDFAKTLSSIYYPFDSLYHRVPTSAASKFLWMRFRSPIIIYDRSASKWLAKPGSGYRHEGGYASYCNVWRIEYCKLKDDIRNACAELKDVKRFTLASDLPEDEFSNLTNSEWFGERVFDHLMLNEVEAELNKQP